MSVDLRTIRAESKALLQNKAAIAINQDALGKQGKRIAKVAPFMNYFNARCNLLQNMVSTLSLSGVNSRFFS